MTLAEAVCQGGERGGVMLPEFGDFAGEYLVKVSARRSEGGGGLKAMYAYAPCGVPTAAT